MVRQVNVAVMVVYTSGSGGKGEGVVCADDMQGVVRREDVRATEKDKVLVGEGFRVGDLVRAVVVGLFSPCPFFFSWVRDFLREKGRAGKWGLIEGAD